MELLEGRTLRQLLCDRPFTIKEAIACAIQITEVLQKTHGKGVVHCDITPANLFITEEGRIKLLDFGIAQPIRDVCARKSSTVHARSTRSTLTGTVRYMSPEQALGREVDARSDIFSAGIVLYEMLTGRLPFNGADVLETIHQVIHHEPAAVRSINSSIPVAVEKIVHKCLEKIPERRYPSAAELQKDLMRVIGDHDAPSSLAEAAQRPAETHELTDPSLSETVPDWMTHIAK